MKKILILSANPLADISLDREVRDLENLIRSTNDSKEFQIDIGISIQSTDLQRLMLEHQPNIVHFYGHGTGEEGLVFRDQKIDTDALSGLFKLFKKHLECVVLNGCYSQVQANEIVKHIRYVIGMNQALIDDTAIAFSRGFYQALGYGLSYERAYEFARNAMELERPFMHSRKLIPIDEGVKIPEHLAPILYRNIALSDVEDIEYALSPSNQGISQNYQQLAEAIFRRMRASKPSTSGRK